MNHCTEERQDWLPRTAGAEELEHDNLEEQEVEEVSGTKYNNYFSAPRFYCVETICAPCGVVIAWRKFAKAEGVAKILRFLEDTWCNPAPLNGAAPNLVVVDEDKEGRPYYKRAFNTQACEQLNAWLGGFQTVLNRMTVSNFDFTMHVLLFLHTQCVIARQEEKRGKKTAGIEEVVENEESDDDDIIEY
ncbi:hypothetical protein BDN71DRAFT_1482021 [Pleurotus eryngii]|uniref:Uncharacterized protein n=1 Tax=Pleurotus eryngii TaxID=5323 RepID=A0A9P6A0R7_PLEER|nr:hypothetical protein BDN71DRAFT_1482021 [Pleurotus eryngii]